MLFLTPDLTVSLVLGKALQCIGLFFLVAGVAPLCATWVQKSKTLLISPITPCMPCIWASIQCKLILLTDLFLIPVKSYQKISIRSLAVRSLSKSHTYSFLNLKTYTVPSLHLLLPFSSCWRWAEKGPSGQLPEVQPKGKKHL